MGARKKIKEPYGEGYTHEALHASWMIMDLLERHVIEHRCAEEFKDVYEAADKAHQALWDLYQLIGTKWNPAP